MAIEARHKPAIRHQSINEDLLSDRINRTFDDSKHAVFGVDAAGNIRYWNKRCEQIFKLPSNSSLHGQQIADLLRGGDTRCACNTCSDCGVYLNIQNQLQISGLELSIRQADGEILPFDIGSCYFYRHGAFQTCTYFSLTEVSKAKQSVTHRP